MEAIIANLFGKTRHTTRNGRKYIVAPATLIVPGVLKGSQGALYYPPEEIARSVQAWNGMPLVVYHPVSTNGDQVSARSPDLLDYRGVGEVFNTKMNGKLTAEVWFDVERTQKVYPGILTALAANKPIELSTGLFTDNEEADEGAEHEGKPYTHIARNYRPDHLAILPDQTGACSIKDGCGVLVNKDESHTGDNDMDPKAKKKIIDNLIANVCCWEEEDRETLNDQSDEKLTKLADNAKKQAATELVANAAVKEFKDDAGTSHTFNAEKGTWESKLKEDPTGDKKKKKSDDLTGNKKPPTTQEWLDAAPEEVRNTIQYARDIEIREKTEIIEKLVKNVKDEQEQAKLTDKFMKKSLSDLRDMRAIMPAESKRADNWAGAGAPSRIAANAEDGFAPFGLPTEYIEEEKSGEA